MKLIRFTDPYEEEHIFNIFGRYKKMRGYVSYDRVSKDLRGISSASGNTNLPNRLGKLIDVLPPNHQYSVDYFIEKHTLFPLFSAFLPSYKVESLRKFMEGTKHGYRVKGMAVKFFRYCPECVQDDRTNYGEAFFHREHQVPFIDLCCHHECILLETKIKVVDENNYFTLEAILEKEVGQPISIPDFIDQTLLRQLGHDTYWLLNRHAPTSLFQVLRENYSKLLINKGLMTDSRLDRRGVIKRQEFLKEFERHYSESTVGYFGAGFNNIKSPWLCNIIQTDFMQPPILHLLLSNFFGHSVKDLSTTNIELYPLPISKITSWPCLNHLCQCFHKNFIRANFTYTAGKKKKRKQSVTVACPDCGYTYLKAILLGENDDLYKVGSVTKYGWLWDKTLKELWENPTLSLTDIRLYIHVDYATLIRQAIRLNLTPFRTYGTVFGMIEKGPLTTDEILKASLDSSHDITDDQWVELKPLINQSSRKLKGKIEHQRGWINGIVWKYHYSLAWTYIPTRYGNTHSIDGIFKKWRKSGLINKIFAILGLDISTWNANMWR